MRQLARRSRDASQARRLVALAVIYDGAARGDAARLAGVTLQIVRDWGEVRPEKRPVGVFQRQALVARGEAGPIPAVHGVVHWRLVDLAQWVWEAFRLSISV